MCAPEGAGRRGGRGGGRVIRREGDLGRDICGDVESTCMNGISLDSVADQYAPQHAGMRFVRAPNKLQRRAFFQRGGEETRNSVKLPDHTIEKLSKVVTKSTTSPRRTELVRVSKWRLANPGSFGFGERLWIAVAHTIDFQTNKY